MMTTRDFCSPKSRILLSLSLASWALFFQGCQHQEPSVIYMPDMVWSPAMKAQAEGSTRMPVVGTIPRGYQPFAYANRPEAAGKELKNPLVATEAVLARGKQVFETHCLPCHGASGEGDGPVVPSFPHPPSLHSDKVREWSDGRIYYVATLGQNVMPGYAAQISEGNRWAVIHYIRALQKSKRPTEKELKLMGSGGK